MGNNNAAKANQKVQFEVRTHVNQLGNCGCLVQLNSIMNSFGRTGARALNEYASEETRISRKRVLNKTLRMICAEEGLNSLLQLTEQHIPKIIAFWHQEGVSAHVRANYFAHLRWLFLLLGKEVQTYSAFENVPTKKPSVGISRSLSSWTYSGVEFDEIHARFMQEDPIAAHLLFAMKETGWNLKAYLCSHGQYSNVHPYWDVSAGPTKNPSSKSIGSVLDEFSYQSLLDGLRNSVDDDLLRQWESRTILQVRRHMLNLAAKFGLTQANLGVTYTGLRKDYVITQYSAEIGRLPVLGERRAIDYETLTRLKLKLMDADSTVPDISTKYLGNFESFQRTELNRFLSSWKIIKRCLPKMQNLLAINGAQNLYWVGTRAMGRGRSVAQSFEFVFEPAMNPTLTDDLELEISDMVTSSSGINCTVRQWKKLSDSDAVTWEHSGMPLFLPIAPNAM